MLPDSGPAPVAPQLPAPAKPLSVFRLAMKNIRRRVVAGLLLVLPFVVTFWILYWLYLTLDSYVIDPVARLVLYIFAGRQVHLPGWFVDYGAPLLGMIAVAILLYFLGFLARLRWVKIIDYLLLKVPVVTVVHSAVSKVFQSFAGQTELTRFKRVVLVAFPHPGMRVPGFVTSYCRDIETQKSILCIYVPTTPVPTSGYMLLVPEEEVTDLDWNLEETLQAVVSAGITTPDTVRYHGAPPANSDAALATRDL